jgi:hypothetical protein
MVHVWMQSQQVHSIVGAGDEDGTIVGAGDEDGTSLGALIGEGDDDGTIVGAGDEDGTLLGAGALLEGALVDFGAFELSPVGDLVGESEGPVL